MRLDDLRTLYDDPGPFASCYLEVSRDQEDGDHVVELAARAAGDDLASQGAPGRVVDAVCNTLTRGTGQPAPISRCVVASARGVLHDALVRARHAHPVVRWAPLPDLAGWLADASRSVRFVLALVDHEGADVASYSADGIDVVQDRSVGEPAGWEHKVRGGGWSHLNWQRSAETVWRENATESDAEIQRQLATGDPTLLVVAGDERSRAMVTERLPRPAADVVVLDRAGRAADGGDDALAADVEEAVRGHVVERHLDLLHELRERSGRGHAVAYGVSEVVDAFVRGQVSHVLLDADAAHDRELRPADHPGLVLGSADLPASVPADQALVAASVLSGAEVDVVGPAALGGEPAAALLRWDQEPT